MDHYLGIPFDLSEVLFIATANYLDRIPGPLLDRMERVDFAGYTEAEKLQIAKRYLLPRQRRENSLTEEELTMTDEAVLTVVQHYTREAGVRQLEREVGKFARKVARKIAAGKMEQMEATPDDVRELLGRPRVHPERMAEEDIGGRGDGHVLHAHGRRHHVRGGQRHARGGRLRPHRTARRRHEGVRPGGAVVRQGALGAPGHPRGGLKGREVHIHVPAGAIPKDGPSAGITMATALVSALSGRKVRHDVAMTGELTLTGRVLPIGGSRRRSWVPCGRGSGRSSSPRRTRRTSRTSPTTSRRCSPSTWWRRWTRSSRWL